MNLCLGYMDAWKVLEAMVADFRKRGIAVPDQLMNDLKSAKTMIQISKAEKGHVKTVRKIEEYLTNVESYLALEGEIKFGLKHVDEWLKRLDEAKSHISDEEEGETRFVPGLPRSKNWVRVKPTVELPIGKLEALASESQLSHKMQMDGSLLVFGKDEHVKDFIKKMATKYGIKTGKQRLRVHNR